MHYFCPEVGGERFPELYGVCGGKRPWCVQCTNCTRFRCYNSCAISQQNGAKQMEVYSSRKQHLSGLVAGIANNQFPSCTLSTTECLLWRVLTPVERHPLQEFQPEMEGGGRFPQSRLMPGSLHK